MSTSAAPSQPANTTAPMDTDEAGVSTGGNGWERMEMSPLSAGNDTIESTATRPTVASTAAPAKDLVTSTQPLLTSDAAVVSESLQSQRDGHCHVETESAALSVVVAPCDAESTVAAAASNGGAVADAGPGGESEDPVGVAVELKHQNGGVGPAGKEGKGEQGELEGLLQRAAGLMAVRLCCAA